MARPRATVVLPPGSRPGPESSLGNHEARIKAIERQLVVPDVDFLSRFVDVYNQAIDVAADTDVDVDWSQNSTSGSNELITNDSGSLANIDPIVGTETYSGEYFSYDFGSEPTQIGIEQTGSYICAIGARFYAAGDTEPTLPFTGRIVSEGGQHSWGAGIVGPSTQIYFVPGAGFICEMSHIDPFVFTSTGLSTPWWRAARIRHNSSEVVRAHVEMLVVRVAPVD
jgi:hypothetical protein